MAARLKSKHLKSKLLTENISKVFLIVLVDDVEQNNYDSAITKSRTLLEETFCYVIEKKGECPTDSGDMAKLFKQVKDLYNMHTDRNTDKRINTLLSGLNSIVSSIAEMRNKDSDAHGVGANRISIDEHHARLFVNVAMTMAETLFFLWRKKRISLKYFYVSTHNLHSRFLSNTRLAFWYSFPIKPQSGVENIEKNISRSPASLFS